MYSDLETKIVSIYAENGLEYGQMTAAAHRKEFCEPLDKSQDYCLKPFHRDYFLLNSLMGLRLSRTTNSVTAPSSMRNGATYILVKLKIA